MTDVVLVHGLWADRSSWNEVTPLLEAAGHRVHTAQLPMTSLDDDVAHTRQIIDSLPGPVVVAGWSYGGIVITNAAYGAKNVSALAYVTAFAPDADENGQEIMARFPSPMAAVIG